MDEESADIGPHLGLKRLIAYRQGTLPAAEREALQEHLSLCKRCTGRLLELRDFEAASAEGNAAGPESLRQDAWESLTRRLPLPAPAVQPVAGPRPAPQRASRFVYAIAAALLLAVASLSVWAAVTVRQERRRLALLEQRLEEREEELAAAQRSLAEAERQLAAARGEASSSVRPEQPNRMHQLEARVAELTSALEKLRRTQAPEAHDRLAAAREVEVSVAPRFALRGQEPDSGVLQGGGTVNPVRTAQAGRFAVALSLADHPVYGEYRLELADRDGELLWAGRRPGKSLLGDAGTSVTVNGISPGLYRLRIEGLQADGKLLAEYLLQVEQHEATPK